MPSVSAVHQVPSSWLASFQRYNRLLKRLQFIFHTYPVQIKILAAPTF